MLIKHVLIKIFAVALSEFGTKMYLQNLKYLLHALDLVILATKIKTILRMLAEAWTSHTY